MSIRNANGESVDGSVGKIADLPNAPTIGTPTDVGTSRAYNNGAVNVAFTPDTTYWPATSYTATSTPGSLTGTGASSPVTVTGLSSQTAYTFTVKGSNTAGASVASGASASVTATTIPDVPVITATPTIVSTTSVTIPFTVNTGGKTISAITAVSSPSIGLTVTGTTSPVTVTGTFVGGQAYTFTLSATNANGSSAASSASNSVTPLNLPTVTGGTLTSDATYYYRTFTANGTLTISNMSLAVDALIVSGGGYGSGGNGGGGGAGGILSPSATLAVNSYPITIGGAATNSSFNGSSPTRGGDGGSPDGGAGGSGGGGSGSGFSGNTFSSGGTGVAGPPRQGYNGGQGFVNDTGFGAGGGGGGSGAVGVSNVGDASAVAGGW